MRANETDDARLQKNVFRNEFVLFRCVGVVIHLAEGFPASSSSLAIYNIFPRRRGLSTELPKKCYRKYVEVELGGKVSRRGASQRNLNILKWEQRLGSNKFTTYYYVRGAVCSVVRR